MKHIENNVKLKRLNKFEGVIKAGRKIGEAGKRVKDGKKKNFTML